MNNFYIIITREDTRKTDKKQKKQQKANSNSEAIVLKRISANRTCPHLPGYMFPDGQGPHGWSTLQRPPPLSPPLANSNSSSESSAFTD